MEHLVKCDSQYSFLLFGAKDVADVAAAILCRYSGRASLLDITGMNLDLRIGSALLARCLGCISNDSVAMHLSIGHRLPTVGLFGTSPLMHYVPWLCPLGADSPGGMAGISSARVAAAFIEQIAAFPRDNKAYSACCADAS